MATNIAKLLSIVSPKDAKGVRAFHGSRANFDKFDDSFIGTGYGRNFGAGHYFSTDPTIAFGYRQRMGPPTSVQVGEGSFKWGYPEDGTDFLPRQYYDNLKRMGFTKRADTPKSILEREQIRESLMQEIANDHKKSKLFRALPPEGQRKMILGILDDRIIRAESTATNSEGLVALRDELSKPGTVSSEFLPSKDSMHEVELDLGPYGISEHGANTLLEYPSMGPQPRRVMDILEGIPSQNLQRSISERGYDIPGHEVRASLEADAYDALKKKYQKELDEIDGDEYDKEQFLDFAYGGYNTAQEQAAKQLGDAGIPASAHTDGMGIKGRSFNYVIHPGQTDRIRQLSKYAVPGAVAFPSEEVVCALVMGL